MKTVRVRRELYHFSRCSGSVNRGIPPPTLREERNRSRGAATVEEILDQIGSRVRERCRADGEVCALHERVPVLDHVFRSSRRSPTSILLAGRKARGPGGIVAQRRRWVTEQRTQDAGAKVTLANGCLHHRFQPHLCVRAWFVWFPVLFRADHLLVFNLCCRFGWSLRRFPWSHHGQNTSCVMEVGYKEIILDASEDAVPMS